MIGGRIGRGQGIGSSMRGSRMLEEIEKVQLRSNAVGEGGGLKRKTYLQ